MSEATSGVAVAVSATAPAREPVGDAGDLQVVGAEVVPPGAHAVGLVHGEEADAGAGEAGEEALVVEALRRDVEEHPLAGVHPPQDLARLLGSERAVEPGGGDPPAAEVVHLVLHQGDEGAHHDRDAVEELRAELVDQALAAPRGQDHQRPPVLEERGDRLPLAGEEAGVAEAVAKHRLGAGQGGGGGHSLRSSERGPPARRWLVARGRGEG
jgi:hypothetical protein